MNATRSAGDEAATGRRLGETEALHLLIENSTDMLSRHAPDGTYRYVSPACHTLLGYRAEELIGRPAYDLFHPDDIARIAGSHADVLDGPDLDTITYRIRHRLDGWRWFETTSHTIRDGGGDVVEIQTSSRDVTERVEAEERLRESEEQWRLAMDNAPIGMALVALDGTFLAVNQQLGAIVGRDHEELLELTFQDITHAEDLEADFSYVHQLLAGEIDRYTLQKRYLHADGHIVWVLLSCGLVRDIAGQPVRFIAQIQDITRQMEQDEALRQTHAAMELLAYEDELTGLRSRRGALEVLEHELRRDDRSGLGVSVLVADVDRFKSINDQFGHAEGDRVLRDLAASVRRAVRHADCAGRIGGDEILVAMPETSIEDAALVADRLRDEVLRTVATENGPVSVSVGVATRLAGEGSDRLIARADAALYDAKRAGRDRTVVVRGT